MSKTVKKVELVNGDGVLDLRKDRVQAGFKIQKIEQTDTQSEFQANTNTSQANLKSHPDHDELTRRMESFAEKLEQAVIKVAPAEHRDPAVAKEMIKVKFVKFVQLVASRDFVNVLEKNQDEDIIISSNLLTELASSVDQKVNDKKIPIIFIVGLALGVALTYFLISK